MAEAVSNLPPLDGKNGGVKPVPGLVLMNGGNGTYSYSKNSYYQKFSANAEREKIEEEIVEKLDVENLLTSSNNTIRIADLGCATGPNTFTTMESALEAIKRKYQTQCPNSPLMPEFQVFFNDQVMNDFNTLFTSLPHEREYFAVGVPGSFYGRLFPQSSLHFVHSSFALHWLSKLPSELEDESSPAWNKGRIHYTNAPEEVVKAYAGQFDEDMGRFLDARAKEMVSGGMLVMIMSGIPKGMPYSFIPNGMMYDSMATSLLELAKEGLIKESQVDSFNLPYYAASPEEMVGIVERKGHFMVDRVELTNPASWLQGPVNIPIFLMHVRAAMEGHFAKHFGHQIIDQFFQRLETKLLDNFDLFNSRCHEKVQLSVVLRRK
ncbi:loganic acid O-methyltransferase-like [Ziziphus jujuba]|uniref:Loganic acid O-methyltransferase-like n=1 Tax=Ziziphus jujuba TaxID=326968 RepID=A0ABM3I1Y0_ZIZJJ|nr:loganic acid O-methyltransferase-like [Ziziphus jujuba]